MRHFTRRDARERHPRFANIHISIRKTSVFRKMFHKNQHGTPHAVFQKATFCMPKDRILQAKRAPFTG